MFAMTLLGPNQKVAIAKSKSGRYIAQALAQAGSIMPNEVKEVIGPYLDNVGQQLEQGRLAEDPTGFPGGPSTSGWPTNSGYPTSPGYSANQGNGLGQGGDLGIDPIAAGSSILDRFLNKNGNAPSSQPQPQPQYQPQPQPQYQPQPQSQPPAPNTNPSSTQPRLPQLPF